MMSGLSHNLDDKDNSKQDARRREPGASNNEIDQITSRLDGDLINNKAVRLKAMT